MLKYYTEAWVEEVAERIAGDKDFRKVARRLTGIFGFRIYDCPDGNDRSVVWTFKNGRVVDWTYEAEASPWHDLRQAPFDRKWVMRATTTYELSAELNKGRTSPLHALSSPDYQIEGSKLMLMQLMKALSAWNELAASVACTYEYVSED